jgi:hypothetical protein
MLRHLTTTPAPAARRRWLSRATLVSQPDAGKTIAGDENVHQVHRLIGAVQGPRVDHARLRRERRLVEHWSCVIDGHCQHGVDVFDLDKHDPVADQRVWVRPWPVTNLLRDKAMASGLDILPIDAWIPLAHPRPLA